MSDDSAVSRSVLADQVKDRLLPGHPRRPVPPHSRSVETRVARELGTSQAPVREALRGLEGLGVVEILPFRRVRACAAHDAGAAGGVRRPLGAGGDRRAPRRSPTPTPSLADLEALGAEM